MLELLAGIFLGLSLAAPPGPMNALIAQEARRHGAWGAIRVGIAAPLADCVYLVALLAARPLLEFVGHFTRPWAVVGALIMAYLAAEAFRAKPTEPAPRRKFSQAFALGLSNPFQAIWWLTAGVTFLALQGPLGLLGFTFGIFGWVFGFSFLVSLGTTKVKWIDRAVHYGSPLLLVVFAALMMAHGLFGVQL